MWAAVTARSHAVTKIFPFGSGSNEFMLYGTVKYTSKTGQDSGKEWAARAELVEDASGELKFKFYQVYLVRLGDISGSLILPCFYAPANIIAGYGRTGLLSGLKELFDLFDLFELLGKIDEQRPDLVACLNAVPVSDTFKSLERDLITTITPAAVLIRRRVRFCLDTTDQYTLFWMHCTCL